MAKKGKAAQGEFQIEKLSISDLTPYSRNSRTHSPGQISQIAASIREFGFTNPVLIDADNVIIAGHGRIEGAALAGLTDVPCIRLSNLTPEQCRAYVIADNQIALNAGYDFDILAAEIDDLRDDGFDIDLLGFNRAELNELIGTPNGDFEPLTKDDQEKQTGKKGHICPNCGHEF